MLKRRIKKFLRRPDVREKFVVSLLKRFQWRFHWLSSNDEIFTGFSQDSKIYLPKTGSAALIYYQGFSEPATADLVQRFLKPGMVMMDVGAHLGEYTLLAAEIVGKTGQVHAFEPQASLFPIVKKNIETNGFDQVIANCCAVSDKEGEVEFAVCPEPSVSSIRKITDKSENAEIVRVPTTSLEHYWGDRGTPINLIKVDVEGAEKFVFEGARKFMGLDYKAPTWIFEYAPRAYRKFNYQAQELLSFLADYGYKVFKYKGIGKLEVFDPEQPSSGIINLVATKDKDYLESALQDKVC